MQIFVVCCWIVEIIHQEAVVGISCVHIDCLFKDCPMVEKICKPFNHRSAKLRCGVAPIKLETGRFENLDLQTRICFNCNILNRLHYQKGLNIESQIKYCFFYEINNL